MPDVESALRAEIERLRAELQLRDRRLADGAVRQNATAEVLRVISTSPTEVERVLFEAAERAARLVVARSASVWLARPLLGNSRYLYLDPAYGPLASDDLSKVAPGRWVSPAQAAGSPDAIIQQRRPFIEAYRSGRSVHSWGTRQAIRERFPDAQVMDAAAQYAVPLLDDDGPFGVLQVVRDGETPFSEEDRALIETFADHVTIAIRNARLFDELEQRNRDLAESLEQQTATSEILSIISTSPTDLQPVFQAVVERAQRLTGSSSASMVMRDGDTVRWLAEIGPTTTVALKLPRNREFTLDRLNPFVKAIVDNRSVHAFGTPAEVESAYPDMADIWRQSGFERRTALVTPLSDGDAALGALIVTRSDGLPFSERQVALLETFSAQVVIATRNTRLFHELQQRNRDLAAALKEQTAVAEVLEVISRSKMDLQEVLDAIVRQAETLTDSESCVLDLHIGTASHTVAVQRNGTLVPNTRLSTPRVRENVVTPGNPAWDVRHSKRPVLLSGGEQAIREQYPGQAPLHALRRTLDIQAYGSELHTPLMLDGQVFGTLIVLRASPEPYTQEQAALLETFAHQAVVAMENARLFNEIEQKTRELEAANAAKSQFLSAMSHELRTPLNAVIGYSEILAEVAADGGHDDMIPDLNRINGAGKHLLSLINNVLDISKIEAGKMELEVRDFTVSDVLAEVEAVVPPLMSTNGNRFFLEVADDLGTAHTDMTKLRQCLLNLLSNAAKFTDHGTVTLAARRSTYEAGDNLTFAVADTGIGMSEEQLGRLFQNFTQAEAGTSSRYGGTGLGLSLSRDFARLMGGDITVESELGKGSTFRLTLPVAVKAPSPTEPR